MRLPDFWNTKKPEILPLETYNQHVGLLYSWWNDHDSGALKWSMLNTTGSFGVGTSTKTAAYTLGPGDMAVFANSTGGAFTITLPTAVGISGRTYFIKRVNGGANNVTVDGAGTETIDGALTVVLAAQYAKTWIISDGANWMVMAP